MHVAALHVWPVKGLAGLSVTAWPVDARGLRLDRAWMIVDAAGQFVTQRTVPQLTCIRTALTDTHLHLTYEHQTLAVPLSPATRPMPTLVQVWDDTCAAWEESGEVHAWLSQILAQPVRLVRMTDTWQRQVDPRFAPTRTVTGFSDGFPVLVTTTASLDALNGHLDAPVTMERFRANVIIGQATPWAEDDWRHLRIGDVRLDLVKPCARCQVPAVDPQTGVVDKEPVRALAQLRRIGGKVLFGVNALATPGVLRVGDQVDLVDPQSVA